MILALDIDGTITNSPLHWFGASRFGLCVWRVLELLGIAQRLMRRAKPAPLVQAWLQEMVEAGHQVYYVTSRDVRHGKLTREWLQSNGFWFTGSTLYLRPSLLGTVEHKVLQILGTDFFLEDDEDVAVAVHKTLMGIHVPGVKHVVVGIEECRRPLVVHITNWWLQIPLLRELIIAKEGRMGTYV